MLANAHLASHVLEVILVGDSPGRALLVLVLG
jgi:hypothetical protein